MITISELQELSRKSDEALLITYEEKEERWLNIVKNTSQQGEYQTYITTCHKEDFRIFAKKLNEKNIYCTLEEYIDVIVARILWF